MEETICSTLSFDKKQAEKWNEILPHFRYLISALCVNPDRFSVRLIFLNVYRIKYLPDKLGFRRYTSETFDNLSILEDDESWTYANSIIFPSCLRTIINIQLRDNECILVLSRNFGDNWHHLLAKMSPLRCKINYDGGL